MTDAELDAIARTWSPSPDGYGLDVANDPESMARHAKDVLGLIAEIRALRADLADALDGRCECDGGGYP